MGVSFDHLLLNEDTADFYLVIDQGTSAHDAASTGAEMHRQKWWLRLLSAPMPPAARFLSTLPGVMYMTAVGRAETELSKHQEPNGLALSLPLHSQVLLLKSPWFAEQLSRLKRAHQQGQGRSNEVHVGGEEPGGDLWSVSLASALLCWIYCDQVHVDWPLLLPLRALAQHTATTSLVSAIDTLLDPRGACLLPWTVHDIRTAVESGTQAAGGVSSSVCDYQSGMGLAPQRRQLAAGDELSAPAAGNGTAAVLAAGGRIANGGLGLVGDGRNPDSATGHDLSQLAEVAQSYEATLVSLLGPAAVPQPLASHQQATGPAAPGYGGSKYSSREKLGPRLDNPSSEPPAALGARSRFSSGTGTGTMGGGDANAAGATMGPLAGTTASRYAPSEVQQVHGPPDFAAGLGGGADSACCHQLSGAALAATSSLFAPAAPSLAGPALAATSSLFSLPTCTPPSAASGHTTASDMIHQRSVTSQQHHTSHGPQHSGPGWSLHGTENRPCAPVSSEKLFGGQSHFLPRGTGVRATYFTYTVTAAPGVPGLPISEAGPSRSTADTDTKSSHLSSSHLLHLGCHAHTGPAHAASDMPGCYSGEEGEAEAAAALAPGAAALFVVARDSHVLRRLLRDGARRAQARLVLDDLVQQAGHPPARIAHVPDSNGSARNHQAGAVPAPQHTTLLVTAPSPLLGDAVVRVVTQRIARPSAVKPRLNIADAATGSIYSLGVAAPGFDPKQLKRDLAALDTGSQPGCDAAALQDRLTLCLMPVVPMPSASHLNPLIREGAGAACQLARLAHLKDLVAACLSALSLTKVTPADPYHAIDAGSERNATIMAALSHPLGSESHQEHKLRPYVTTVPPTSFFIPGPAEPGYALLLAPTHPTSATGSPQPGHAGAAARLLLSAAKQVPQMMVLACERRQWEIPSSFHACLHISSPSPATIAFLVQTGCSFGVIAHREAIVIRKSFSDILRLLSAMEVTLSAPHDHTFGCHSGPGSSAGVHHFSTTPNSFFSPGAPRASSFMLPVIGQQMPGAGSSVSPSVRSASRSGQALISTLAHQQHQHTDHTHHGLLSPSGASPLAMHPSVVDAPRGRNTFAFGEGVSSMFGCGTSTGAGGNNSGNNSPSQTPSRTRVSLDLGRLLPPRPGLPPPSPASACRKSLEILPMAGGQSQGQLSQSQLSAGQLGSPAGSRPPSLVHVHNSSTAELAAGEGLQGQGSSMGLTSYPSRLSVGGPSRTTSSANNLASLAAAAAAGALPGGGPSSSTPEQADDVLQSAPSVRLAYGEVLAQQGRVPWSQLPGSMGSIRGSHSPSLKSHLSGNLCDAPQASPQGLAPISSGAQPASSPHTSASQLHSHLQPQPPSGAPVLTSSRGPRTIRRTSLEFSSPTATGGGAVLPAAPSGCSTPTRLRTSLDFGMQAGEALGAQDWLVGLSASSFSFGSPHPAPRVPLDNGAAAAPGSPHGCGPRTASLRRASIDDRLLRLRPASVLEVENSCMSFTSSACTSVPYGPLPHHHVSGHNHPLPPHPHSHTSRTKEGRLFGNNHLHLVELHQGLVVEEF